MDPVANQRIAPGRVVLILALLLAVWLGFQYLPQRKEPAPPMTPVRAESKLRSVGLADNPDWDGLPQIFAVWADHAEWTEGRTRFAYWHPVMKTYSYYFEATRDGAGLRFHEITEPHDPARHWDESLGEDSPIRFYHSDSVPTSPPTEMPQSLGGVNGVLQDRKTPRPDSIVVPPVELKPEPIVVPPAGIKTRVKTR